MPEPDALGAARSGSIEGLDRALEELRHSTFGFYGARLRAVMLHDAHWEFSRMHYRLVRTVEATEPLRPTVEELAAALLTDKARASRLIDQVQEAGLVRRRIGRLDRRRREIELTEAGRAVLDEVRKVRLARLRHVLSGWTDAELDQLHRPLHRFNASVREAPEWLSDATERSSRRRS